MYYRLKKTTRLRREDACAVIFSADSLADMHYTHPVNALLLSFCNGLRSREDFTELLAASVTESYDQARAIVDAGLETFAGFLQVTPDPAPSPWQFDPLEFLYEPKGDPKLLRLSAPVEIAWLVTQRCPYDCIYCCIETLPARAPAPSEMSERQAHDFVEDCATSGVAVVILHGGEPFLRRDLPALIARMIRHNIHVRASTKLRLTDRIVRELADGGLEELQLSIDTVDPALADTLVGRSRYLDRAYHNIELLLRHGIRAKSNTVVTGKNVAMVPDLIRALIAKGVVRVSLSGYLRSFHKHDDSLFAGREALHAMAREVREIERAFPEVRVEMCPLEDQRELSLCTDGFGSCSGGKTGLVVGPDGNVTFCDRLLGFPEAIVGNVLESSLLEIWEGPELRAFVEPDRTSFEGTACFGCGLRSVCDHRLRCAYRSLMVDHRVYGPDYLCPATPPPPLRFF